jgi:hypothetical protein
MGYPHPRHGGPTAHWYTVLSRCTSDGWPCGHHTGVHLYTIKYTSAPAKVPYLRIVPSVRQVSPVTSPLWRSDFAHACLITYYRANTVWDLTVDSNHPEHTRHSNRLATLHILYRGETAEKKEQHCNQFIWPYDHWQLPNIDAHHKSPCIVLKPKQRKKHRKRKSPQYHDTSRKSQSRASASPTSLLQNILSAKHDRFALVL